VPTVRAAAALLTAPCQVASEDQNWSTSVSGTAPEYFEVRSWRAARGSLFGQADVEGGAKVAVLGATVVEMLFGSGADPVGQTVRIRNVPFLVVGVLERKGQSPIGQDFDDAVFVPQSAFLSKIKGGLQQYIGGVIFVSALSPEATERAQAQLTTLLRDRHRIVPGVEDDFSIRNLAEVGAAFEQGTRTLTLLLASIAAVSLLVGGIGIMNIMLVSVTERTREIGIRMAVGAKPRHILAQFLVEALALSVAGGLLGVALGFWAGKQVAGLFGWPLAFRLDVVVLAIGFSGLVGIVFGLYPARKASRLDPIDALRFE
jgi:putative ABC transport system permease protein